MPAAGGEAVQITPNGEGRDVPQESPDGKFVYYQKGWQLPHSLWRMPVGGGEEVKVLDSVHSTGLWTMGKEAIYFFTQPDERGRSDIRFYELATGKIKKILTIERRVDTHIAVSPNGLTILYPQLDQVGSDLMLVENFR
jgi:Tol biopolymer transport system component